MSTPDKKVRSELTGQIRLLLGDQMIDLEADPDHYSLAIDMSFDRFRQRSSNAVEESYAFFELQTEQNEYTMPKEVKSIRQLYRRGVAGLSTGGGSFIDPFSLAFTNLYLLRAGDQGGLATYHFFNDYQETVGRLFGLYINYHYEPVSRKLTIIRRITAPETILIWLYNERSEANLWADEYAKPWLRSYALAQTKLMISEARGLFSQIPGPGGATTLNAGELRASAEAELEKLDTELKNLVTGDMPMWFTIG